MPIDPMAPSPSSSPGAAPAERSPAGGWSVGVGHGAQWWTDGWRIFTASPWLWIGMTLFFVACMFVLAIVPIVGGVASTLLYPVLSSGLLVGARDLYRRQPLTFGHLFSCFDRRLGPLIVVGLIYLVAWFVVWLIAAGICVMIFGLSALSALLSLDTSGVPTFATLLTLGMAVLVALLVVLVLGTPLLMAYWFAPPLVALRGDAPVDAMKASFHATLRNVPPMFVYGLMFIVFAILATIPFGLGWLVLAPVFAGSVYASYRDIFGAP